MCSEPQPNCVWRRAEPGGDTCTDGETAPQGSNLALSAGRHGDAVLSAGALWGGWQAVPRAAVPEEAITHTQTHTHTVGWWLSSDVPSCITEPPNERHPLPAGISCHGCTQSWVAFKETSKPPRRADESPGKNARWVLIHCSEAHPRGEEGMKGGLFCTRVPLGDGPRLPAVPTRCRRRAAA